MGDLPGFAGLMLGCLLIPNSTTSLLPVRVVCKERDLGFSVRQGGGPSEFNQDGVTVLNLDADGSLNLLAADSVIRKSGVQESVHTARLEGRLRGDKSKIHLALVSAGCELPSNRYVNTGGLMSHECAAGALGVPSSLVNSSQRELCLIVVKVVSVILIALEVAQPPVKTVI